MQYIWYCPSKFFNRTCNMIICKTDTPILDMQGKKKCRRCNIEHTHKELMKTNKRNLRKHIETIE